MNIANRIKRDFSPFNLDFIQLYSNVHCSCLHPKRKINKGGGTSENKLRRHKLPHLNLEPQ